MKAALDTVSVGVAAVALLLSVAALLHTRRADKRAQKQEARDERRAQREEAEALRDRQAFPHAEYIGRASSPGRRGYRFRITNSGKQPASDINGYLLDAHRNVVSDESSLTNKWINLLPPNESGEVEVVVTKEQVHTNPLFLQLTWFDESGKNDRISHVDVPSD